MTYYTKLIMISALLCDNYFLTYLTWYSHSIALLHNNSSQKISDILLQSVNIFHSLCMCYRCSLTQHLAQLRDELCHNIRQITVHFHYLNSLSEIMHSLMLKNVKMQWISLQCLKELIQAIKVNEVQQTNKKNSLSCVTS